MSSFPKHSFEQAYDHAFPPSPPNGNNNNNNTSATGSAVPSSATSPSQAYSNNNYNTNSLAAPSGPGLSTISERSPLITKAPIQNHPGSYTSTNNNHDDDDDYHPNNNHHSHGTSVSSTDTLLEQGNSSSSGQYMSIRDLTVREFKILLRYSAPVVLTYVLQNSLQLASLVSLGHLGSIGKWPCFSSYFPFLPLPFRSHCSCIERQKTKTPLLCRPIHTFPTHRKDTELFTAVHAHKHQTFSVLSPIPVLQEIHPLFLLWLVSLYVLTKKCATQAVVLLAYSFDLSSFPPFLLCAFIFLHVFCMWPGSYRCDKAERENICEEERDG